jgi:hypothetical protein
MLLPILLLPLSGGCLGGAAAGLGIVANLSIARSPLDPVRKALAMGAVSVVGVVAIFVLASLLSSRASA